MRKSNLMSPSDSLGTPIQASGLTVAYTTTAGTTARLPQETNWVRVVVTTDAWVEILAGNVPVATSTGMYMVAFVPEYFACPPSGRVSAVRVSTSGSIYVTAFA